MDTDVEKMIRGSDPVWCYVEKMDDGSLKCFFCETVFAGGTSISRIKHHLAGVKGGGAKLCEKVSPDVKRAVFDQLLNGRQGGMPSSSKNIILTRGSDRAQQEGQLLLDGLSWKDILMGEIFHTDENVAPGMPMPDAPETGLGKEHAKYADPPFEMDMSNISSSLMQSVVERGSSSKRPVERSVPSSSNNEATNAASTPVRGLAIEQPRLDDVLIGGETELIDEEPRAPVVLTTDEPETRQRTEQAHQSFETNTVKAANQQDSNNSMQTVTAPYNPYKAANLQSMQQVTQRKGQLNYAEEEEDNPPTIKRKDHVLKAASPNAPAADPPLPYA